MIPHKNLVKHDPSRGKWGDCFRAVVASMLDIEHVPSVPHFFDNGIDCEDAYCAFAAWLVHLNLSPIFVFHDAAMSLSEVLENSHMWHHDVPFILVGETVDGGHCVLCLNGAVWHDTAWIRTPDDAWKTGAHHWLLIFIGAKLNTHEVAE